MPAEETQPTPVETIRFTLSQVDRGTVATVYAQGRSATVLASTALAQHPKFGPILNPLDGPIAASLDRIAGCNQDGYTGPALEREIQTELTRIRVALLAALAGIREIRSEHQVRKTRMLDFNRESGQSLRSDLRSWFYSRNVSQRPVLALDGDWNLLSAVVEAGRNWSGLDADMWAQIEERFMALNHVKVSGLDASHVIPSTTEYLTGAGVDHAAAFATAEKAVKAREAEGDFLDLAEDYFRAPVRALMLVSGKSATEITDLSV